MGVEAIKVGWFSKIPLVLKVFLLLFVFGLGIIAIVNSLIYFTQTNDYHPLLDNTLGKFVYADSQIAVSINEYKTLRDKGELTTNYSSYLKQSIWTNLLFLFLSIFFVYWLFVVIGGGKNILGTKRFLFLPLAFIVIFILEIIYIFVITGHLSFDNFGLISIFKNSDILINKGAFDSIKYIGLEKVNQTINTINQTIVTYSPH